jgi:PAS domain S-box-containing protein
MCLAISLIPIAVISGLQNFQIASAFLGLILAITLAVGYVIAHFISLPLMKLTKNIDEISKGNLDVELENSEIYEINNLTASLDRVMASLKLAIYKVGLKKEEIFQEVIKEKEEAEKKLGYLLKKIDGWIWEIDEKGTCTVCSEKVAEALGYTPQQIVGKDIFGFFPKEEAQKLKDVVNHLASQKKETASTVDFPWLYQGDHHPVWIRSFLIPVFDSNGTFHGLRCFSRDITTIYVAQDQIEKLRKEIKELNSRSQGLPHAQRIEPLVKEPSPEGVTQQEFDYMFLCDEHANIIDCTSDIQKKLGYSKEEMVTLTMADVAILESLEEIRSTLDAIKNQGSINIKTIHRKKNGTSMLVSEHIQYLKDRNMFLCLVKREDK